MDIYEVELEPAEPDGVSAGSVWRGESVPRRSCTHVTWRGSRARKAQSPPSCHEGQTKRLAVRIADRC
jgi:hypothetical protein